VGCEASKGQGSEAGGQPHAASFLWPCLCSSRWTQERKNEREADSRRVSIWPMYRPLHSAPDHVDSPNASHSDFHHRSSEQSSTPLQPLMASRSHPNPSPQEKHVHIAPPHAHSYPPTPGTLESGNASDANAHGRKRASHFIHEGLSYDPSNAKEDYLRMARDDVPDNKVSPLRARCTGLTRPRDVPGRAFLPLPPRCIQSHTLVSKCLLQIPSSTPLQCNTVQSHPKPSHPK
jgi:hypothetical protein